MYTCETEPLYVSECEHVHIDVCEIQRGGCECVSVNI